MVLEIDCLDHLFFGYCRENTYTISLFLSGIKPPSRWIVNFENDFVDGLVLASLICAYAPYVVRSVVFSRTCSVAWD